MKNAMKKLELRVEAAMPCEVMNHKYMETSGESDNRTPMHACIVEAHESTRKRLERALPKDCEDRIAGKGFNSFISIQSCAQVRSCAPGDENS